MREIHAESDATYGEPRMTEELAHRGRVVNHKRVRRLMRNHGIVATGRSIEEAVWVAVKLERACRVQLLAEWAGGPIV